MKKIVHFLSLTGLLVFMTATLVLAYEPINADDVLALLNEEKWIDENTASYNNFEYDEKPDYFVQDMNNDGILEIFVMAGRVRCHADSQNFLITFNKNNPIVYSYAGDKYWGCNPQTGVFANEYFGMGIETINISKLNTNGEVALMHIIEANHGNYPFTDEDIANVAEDGLVYGLSIDGVVEYFEDENSLQNKIDDVMAYYNLQNNMQIYNLADRTKYKESVDAGVKNARELTVKLENKKNITVILNGETLSFDQPPYIENGTTRVPMRAIFEALGATVDYDATTKTITVRKGSTIIELITGASTAKINGREMTLTTSVENKNGSTMVPLRFVSEAFGAEVIWDGENKVININLEEKTYPLYYRSVGYTSIARDISKESIKEDRDISIKKFKPIEGASKAIMGNNMDLPDNNDSSYKGNEQLQNMATAFDAMDLVMSFVSNSMEVTRLHIYTNHDNEMAIKYGSSIELNYSGKKVSLSEMLVDKYYNFSPSILFTSDNKADECIRKWFNLDGDGIYSMYCEFDKAYIGDYGYYLLIEDKKHIFQVPILNEETTMKVYYTEDKETRYLFDAADILRNVKIELSDDAREEIIEQLEENNFTF